MEPFVLQQDGDGPAVFELSSWNNRVGGLSAGFTTRIGGVSDSDFATLNCGFNVPDKPEHVVENRRRVSERSGFRYETFTCGEQVHGNRVTVIGPNERGRGNSNPALAVNATDGLVTCEHDTMLAAFFADCVPLYFYDPVVRAVGLAHAGWKGTVLEIAAVTVETMRQAFGSNPADLLAAIGPSIGRCCYEVDETVVAKVRGLRLAGEDDGYEPRAGGKYMLDLKEINRQIMIKAGILPSCIEVTSLCTSCHADWFYSHRRDHGQTGRMMGWIGLKER